MELLQTTYCRSPTYDPIFEPSHEQILSQHGWLSERAHEKLGYRILIRPVQVRLKPCNVFSGVEHSAGVWYVADYSDRLCIIWHLGMSKGKVRR